MRKTVLISLLSGIAIVTLSTPPSPAQDKNDEAAIRELQTRQADAWN